MTVSVTLAANQRLEVQELGDFFRLMEADLTVTVEFYFQGRLLVAAKNVRSGYAETFRGQGYDRYVVVNGATPQAVQYVARQGSDVLYDVPPIGLVEVTNTGGAFTQALATVTNVAGGVVLSAANPLRRHLLIANKSATGTIYVRVDGGAPTVATGLKLEPGDEWELSGYVPTGAVRAIGDIASNTDVLLIEG